MKIKEHTALSCWCGIGHTEEEAESISYQLAHTHQLFGPMFVGGMFWSGYWRQRYTVTHISEWLVTVVWEDGHQGGAHSTPWTPDRDLIVRKAPEDLFLEYSTDGDIWHFAPLIARQMAADAART